MTSWNACSMRERGNAMFEKVNPCHPDKVADRIAGALVDLAYQKEANRRIAVEVLVGHGVCHIIAETSVKLDNTGFVNIHIICTKLYGTYSTPRMCRYNWIYRQPDGNM